MALGLAAVACLILRDVPNAIPFVLGRLLPGLACGLAFSATATYIVDSAPVSPSRLAATIASSTPSVGLTIGALSSGAKRTGMVVFFLAVVGGIVTLQTKAVVPFILASIVDGVAQGTALSGSILALLMGCSYPFRKCGGKHNYGANTSAGLDASNAFRQLDSVDQQCTRCQRSGVF